MSKYNIHAGHGLANGTGCGAVGILDESVEDRKVKDSLISLLQNTGHTVYDCTYNGNASANTILSEIVKKCNANSVDLDISIHLNSGRNDSTGDGKTGGVEVYGYDANTKTIGEKICSEISSSLGITNRGFKTNTGLYVLKNTKSQAILIECCFVDDKDDANVWNPNKCAQAIYKALTGNSATATTSATTTTTTNKYSVGQVVTYSTSYPSPTLACSTKNATSGAGHGTITAIVSGQAKYKLSTGVYVNDGDIRGLYTATTSTAQYYAKYTGNSTSIADALQSLGVDSSFANRKKIAEKNGISNYRGSADQNTKLLTLLKSGKLVK
jgi:N-acetylmuramoyl-L-alanine amidase